MRVAVIYPKSLFSAWSVSEGIVDTLKRMGHDVISCGVEPGSKQVSRNGITREKLEACDLILVSGPEHIALGEWRGVDYVSLLFPYFDELKVKKVAWLHETIQRADYPCDMPIDRIKKRFDVVYTPAAQDEKHGLRFLPFGVDTEMFFPGFPHEMANHEFTCMYCGKRVPPLERHFYALCKPNPRDIDVAFIGLLYGPRQEFMAKLQPHLGDIKVTMGNCQVVDLGGVNIRKSVELYASELRRCKVLLNLPSLCRHTVTKITEAAACGAYVITDAPEDSRNRVVRSAAYYTGPENCGYWTRNAIADDVTRENDARETCEEVHKNHRLDQRLEVVLK